MKTRNLFKSASVLVVAGLVLAGCGNHSANIRPDAAHGYVSVGKVNHSDMAPVQARIEALLDNKRVQTATQRRVEWSRLLRSYQSRDGQFELAVLTAMALDQLADDQRRAFLRTAARIRDRIDEATALPPETELVLALAQTMGEPDDPLYNPNRDKGRVTLAVYRLVGN